jgi:hypothetical protein
VDLSMFKTSTSSGPRVATLSARFYTKAAGIFYRKVVSCESRKRAILIRSTGHEKPEITGRVPDVGARRGGECFPHSRVVSVWVRAKLAADTQKPGAELLVAPQVLGLEARTLGGEPVGPTQDGELLTKGPGRTG